jgi:transposase
VADGNAASPNRNRLVKERPEVGLARDLIRTEYRLRDERLDKGHDANDRPGLWTRLAARLRRLADRLSGRPAVVPPGGDHDVAVDRAGPWQPATAARAPAPTPTPREAPDAVPGPPPHPDMARLGERIGRLSTLRHEAFEDAVLHLVRTDERWKQAFERSPQSMPTVARYAANAYMRESLRETSASAIPSRRERTSAPSDALRAAQVTSTNSTTDRSTLTAAEAMDAARIRIMADDQRQFDALRARWERTAPERQPAAGQDRSGFGTPDRHDLSDGQAFLAAGRDARQTGRASYAVGSAEGVRTGGPSSPVLPVSPLTPAAPQPALLSGEGHAAVRSSLDALAPLRTPTAPGTTDSPTSPHGPAPGHRPTTPTTPQKRGRR